MLTCCCLHRLWSCVGQHRCGVSAVLYPAVLVAVLLVTVFKYKHHVNILEIMEVFQNQSIQMGLSPEEQHMFRDLAKVFDRITKDVNVSYFLYGGTLMGYARNQSVSPWDDDYDVAMMEDGYYRVVEEVAKLPNYTYYLHAGWILKIFSNTTYTLNYRNKWNWPFLDIFLMRANNTSGLLHDMAWGLQYNLTDVFPLAYDDFFEMREVPVPANVSAVLSVMYGSNGTDVCESNYLDHRYVNYKSTVKIECEKLRVLFKMGGKKKEEEGDDGNDVGRSMKSDKNLIFAGAK